jgi:hypothetical protein
MKYLLLLGFLAGCPTIDVGDTPVEPPQCKPDSQKFQDPGGIWDVAIDPADQTKSCISQNGCHSQATGRSALRLVAKPRAQLSAAEWQTNYEVVTNFLNCSTPKESPFITKPLAGVDPHLGGDLWTCDSTSCEPANTVEQWIAGP